MTNNCRRVLIFGIKYSIEICFADNSLEPNYNLYNLLEVSIK